MTIRDRIFEKLEEMNMSQKDFSDKTGIPQTTVSDWRKNIGALPHEQGTKNFNRTCYGITIFKASEHEHIHL